MHLLAQVNVGDSVEQGLATFFEFLPRLVAFLVILLIAYIVAKVVQGILSRVLQRVGLDRALHSGQTGQYVERFSPGASPSRLIGTIGFWAIFLVGLSMAVSFLGVQALTDFLAAIFAYLPKVIAAVLIFVIAGAIAAAVGALVARTMGDTPTGKVVGTIVPVLIMGIATFMILDQLEIAPQIVTITYAALIGAVALGMALAFGLGGRDVAARMLEDAYRSGQQQKDQVRQDVQQGKDQAQRDAERAKQRGQAEVNKGPGDGAQTEVGSSAPRR